MFGWLSGRPKSSLPEPTALQTQRTKQIDQLKLFNANVSEIQRDVEYRVNTVINGTTLSLYITLPQQFPQDKPIVRVSPPVTHSWVNEQGTITGSPGLNGFVVHSDLGKIVRDIIDEFHRNPPLPKQSINMSGYPGNRGIAQHPPTSRAYNRMAIGPAGYMSQGQMPTLPVSSSVSGPVPPYMTSASCIPGATPSTVPIMSSYRSSADGSGGCVPDVPISFPQLKDLSLKDLQELHDDEESLVLFIQTTGCLQCLGSDKQTVIEKNEELARENMSKKPIIEERKRILLEKYDQLNDLRIKFDEHSQKQDELRLMYDPSSIRNRLQVASVQAEEEAESIAEQFLEGQLPVDEFGKKYMKIRSLSHLRRAKEEKMTTAIIQNRLI